MRELRLVPAACAVWVATLITLAWGSWQCAVCLALAAAAAAAWREPGQAILIAGVGGCAAVVTQLRVVAASRWRFGGEFVATIAGEPRDLPAGGFLVRLSVEGHPGTVPLFTRSLPEAAVAGASVRIDAAATESDVLGTTQVALHGALEVVRGPEGLAGWAHHVKQVFADAVTSTVGPASQGLIPGMVLGDTSLQSPEEEQAYIDTGLSHLSAVSGSNVAIVTSAAAVIAAACGAGLRGRVAVAAAALAAFAALVGPEPSVLRASVMGLVGLVAVLASSTTEPIHALCLAVIGLVMVDSNLAVSYGFALSVVATAGIVALSPHLTRLFAPTGWPEIVLRALSVALAADAVTMPLVASMSGEVSVVSVVSNLAVAPVVAPVTVLGLCAVVLALAPGGLEEPLLVLIEPMTAWIHAVAQAGARLPAATVEAGPLGVVVCYGWVAAGLLLGRPRATLGVAVAAAIALAVGPGLGGRPVDLERLGGVYVVNSEDQIEPVPAGTRVVVVTEQGSPHDRPVVTTGGIPVLYPHRDGPVRLYPDGTQHAVSGRF
ncbi:ComEC/Rec2 family competence protein [Corynebacterium liangguodongii]|uniref:Competence protein ComEC n=1 Tax=Corynebacterium liangguodongii TaxID=2079535 RepID=A0A2S0WFG2_9CORY|nr:ComEC/Rec2 family competence protein [Corynebacterium liangguodongii]AWB84499.1 competence protein ComEC [Corynebacterium liangguodongii]PWB98717.1 ComEC/Rec2 family competence protein [Corynebacterium liangguodongii]